MPVGPSHRGGSRSSSSSGRSHSSSSSRSSYSSNSRSYSSSSHSHHHHYYGDYSGGGGIEISPRGWAGFGIAVGFILTLIMAIIGFVKLGDNVPYFFLMRRDAKEYNEIIEKANNGEAGYYIKEIKNIRWSGTSQEGNNPAEYSFTAEGDSRETYDNTYINAYSEVRKNGVNYYWLEIRFYSEEADERISGITYSYYAEAQVSGLSSLTLVYTKAYDGDGSWDIIQQNYSLGKNIDYWFAGKQIVLGILFIAIAGGLGTLMVWCCKLLNKKNKKDKKDEPIIIEVKTTPTEISDKYKECTYCGSQIPFNTHSCTVCGARKFKKINK